MASPLQDPRHIGQAKYGDIELQGEEERVVSARLFNRIQKILEEKTNERKGKQ